MGQEVLENAADVKIFTRSWRPAGKPRGVVAIVHGFNSHSGHYLWVAEQFVADGLAVYALDLRGRGQSSGERFYVETVGDYVDDLASLVDLAKSREPGLPVFLLGHSAGGVVSCIYALEHQSEIRGFICEDFAYELPTPDIVLSALKGVSRIAPHSHVYKLKNRDFSRDPKVVEELDNDPLIANEAQPAQTAAAMVYAEERLKREFPFITLPVLILHGSRDKVAKPSGSRYFYDQAGSADKTLKVYEGHYHDLLNDIDKEIVMSDIRSWINSRIPAENPVK
jgi:acylglycerol lipase